MFVFGAPYFWNAGYWYPAWGYAPNAYYAWDGPIYTSNSNLPPDQVIANVQASLQQQGYYQGEVDGLLGPQTRGALAAYQRDHGLYETSAIDEPTLQSLGMAQRQHRISRRKIDLNLGSHSVRSRNHCAYATILISV